MVDLEETESIIDPIPVEPTKYVRENILNY
jgi:hypothetical protein